MTTTKDLTHTLQQLQTKAVDIDKLLKSTRNELHWFLVDAYIFYANASKKKGWYEAQLDELRAGGARVKRSKAPHIKFLHLLRLIHKQVYMRNADQKLRTWAQALHALDVVYKANPHVFKSNMRVELYDYLASRTMKNLIAEVYDTIEETGGDKLEDKSTSKRQQTIDAKAVTNAINAKQRQAASAKALGTASIPNVYIAEPNQLALLVGRRL